MKKNLQIALRATLGMAVTVGSFHPVLACGGRRGGYGGYVVRHPVILREKVIVQQPVHVVQPASLPLSGPGPLAQPALAQPGPVGGFAAPGSNAPPAPVDMRALQLVDVRFVDPGDPGRGLGPRFRITLRNAAPAPFTLPVDVMLLAGVDQSMQPGLPQARERVSALAPGQAVSVDIRLPVESLSMRFPGEERPAVFSTLFVVAAGQQDLMGNLSLQPLATLPRIGIPPVDLALLNPANSIAPAGATLILAGEGLGIQPGRVILNLQGVDLNAEILGWSPVGAQVRLPALNLAAPTAGKIIVIRADGQQAMLPIQLVGGMFAQNAGPQGLVPGIGGSVPGVGLSPNGFQGNPGNPTATGNPPQAFGPQGGQFPGGSGMGQPMGQGMPGIGQGFAPSQGQGFAPSQGAPAMFWPNGNASGGQGASMPMGGSNHNSAQIDSLIQELAAQQSVQGQYPVSGANGMAAPAGGMNPNVLPGVNPSMIGQQNGINANLVEALNSLFAAFQGR